jgi:hypothetical protein
MRLFGALSALSLPFCVLGTVCAAAQGMHDFPGRRLITAGIPLAAFIVSTYCNIVPMHRTAELFPGKTASPDCIELRRRLCDLHRQQPPADPSIPCIRIGLENAQGELVDVVETTRLVETVKVFEILSEFGLTPREGRRRTDDGFRLTRVYCQPYSPPVQRGLAGNASVSDTGFRHDRSLGTTVPQP